MRHRLQLCLTSDEKICSFLQDPNKAVVEVGVDGFHVVQRDWFSEQLLVERQRKASVDVVAVKHRHAHNTTHKMEIGQVFLQITEDHNIKTLLI